MKIIFYTDNIEYSRALYEQLSERFEVERVTTAEGLFALLQMPEPRIAVFCLRHRPVEPLMELRRKFPQMNFGLVIFTPSFDLKVEQACFELGADHVMLMATPIALIETKLLNLGRRLPAATAPLQLPRLAAESSLNFEGIEVSHDQLTVRYLGQVVPLSPIHHKLIVAFITRVDQLLTRELLLSLVWPGQSISKRSIDAQISKLKKAFPPLQKHLINLYGRGYVLRSSGRKAA